MIAFVKGRVIEKTADYLVVQVGGIGLEVRAPAGTIEKAPPVGEECSLHTYLCAREDALLLYGFDSRRARDLFVQLMSVSGFGAQKALSVLSVFSPEGFESVIKREDAESLVVIPGIGRKGAQRLVLELKDRLRPAASDLEAVPPGARKTFQEAVEALVQLGYTRLEAHDVLKKYSVPLDEASVEGMLQFALKNIDRGGG